jgi:hypothetical protein
MFWPDKASAHYAKSVTQLLDSQNVIYVPRYRNLTNVPRCRPIEDFFGYLCQLVYKKGWRAQNTKQLERHIHSCLKKVDLNVVTSSVKSIVKRLRKCAQLGPLSVVH